MTIKTEITIEESKQIGELGFNFSKACEKFIAFNAKGDYISPYYETDRETYLPDDVTTKYHLENVHTTVPIIPYPILEACLPISVGNHTVMKNSELRGTWSYEIFTMGFNTYFKDAADAFIHCAKNYPTETKEQFNKIMEMYE